MGMVVVAMVVAVMVVVVVFMVVVVSSCWVGRCLFLGCGGFVRVLTVHGLRVVGVRVVPVLVRVLMMLCSVRVREAKLLGSEESDCSTCRD